MRFSRQEYWSGLPFPSPGDLPDPGIEPRSPVLEAEALTSERIEKGKKIVCFLLPLKRDKNVRHLQPISSVWRPLAFLPVTLSPASGSFPMSEYLASRGQSIGVSASASVFPMNVQDWFHLGLTGVISLQSKGLSKDLSNTTVQKHQFFSAQLSLRSNSHIHTWLLEKP